MYTILHHHHHHHQGQMILQYNQLFTTKLCVAEKEKIDIPQKNITMHHHPLRLQSPVLLFTRDRF